MESICSNELDYKGMPSEEMCRVNYRYRPIRQVLRRTVRHDVFEKDYHWRRSEPRRHHLLNLHMELTLVIKELHVFKTGKGGMKHD
jgi:hypothetical protein